MRFQSQIKPDSMESDLSSDFRRGFVWSLEYVQTSTLCARRSKDVKTAWSDG